MCKQEQRIVSLKRKAGDELKEEANIKKTRMSLKYSNNLDDSVKIFCCECDKVVTFAGLEEHILIHKMSIKMYRQLYGEPKTQIIRPVYHKCGLCAKDLLLAESIIKKHVKNCHLMEFTDYSGKFLGTAKNNIGVTIRCDQCSKTFKRNIQLKAHSKRHLQSQVEEAGFCGFKSIDQDEKKQHLDILIKSMATSIHREKQAIHQFLNLIN